MFIYVFLHEMTTSQIDFANHIISTIETFYPNEVSELNDVRITSPAMGQILTFDGTRWVNAVAQSITVASTQTIGASTTSTVQVLPTTGYAGTGGAEEAMGGITMGKNFITANGSSTPAYSSAINFGPTSTSTGAWRVVSVQPTDGTSAPNYTNTYLTVEAKSGGGWTKSMSFFR